ncbi:UNVERIFIED_CONTAM: hypothetical protein NCL1_48473 [Trichonephila clavipes]
MIVCSFIIITNPFSLAFVSDKVSLPLIASNVHIDSLLQKSKLIILLKSFILTLLYDRAPNLGFVNPSFGTPHSLRNADL